MKFQSLVISSGSAKLENGYGGEGDWELRKVFYEEKGYMAALVYSDKVICCGYDGNEYIHHFIMNM